MTTAVEKPAGRDASEVRRRLGLRLGFLLAAVLVLASSAESGRMTLAFPGANGSIAFTRFLPSGSQIFVMSPNGKRQVQLVRHAGEDGQPAWSRDGRRIAFASVAADGTQGIYLANARGGGLRRLTSQTFDPAAPVLDAHPRWSSDGRRIVFHRFRGPAHFDLYVIDVDGSGLRSLGEGFTPTWSPDGRKIALAYRRTQRDDFDIYVMNANGTGRRRLTTSPANDTEPDWSLDGKRIAFVRQRLDNYEIYAMQADGSRQRRLTHVAAADVSPVWSPDGKKIAFASRRVLRRWDIYVMNADGSRETRLTRSPLDDVQPAWQPLPRRR